MARLFMFYMSPIARNYSLYKPDLFLNCCNCSSRSPRLKTKIETYSKYINEIPAPVSSLLLAYTAKSMIKLLHHFQRI